MFMNKIIVTLLASVVFVTGVFGQVTSESQRQRPQRVQLTEAQQAIGKAMAEDKGIQKIRQKAIKDMIAYLVKKGHSEEDAKAVVEAGARAAERVRSSGRGGWGNRQGGPQRGEARQGRGEYGPRRTQGGQRPGGDRPQRQRSQN